MQYPDIGLYHPRAPGRVVADVAALPGDPAAPAVGLLLMRSYVLSSNAAHYDGVIAAMEAAGLRVRPAFASGLDARPAIQRYFTQDGQATVDAVVSLTGFSLVGGPAYNDARGAETALAALDVPYLAAHPVEFQTLGEWQDNAHGLTPIEATMMVAIPELDGATGPMTFGGRTGMGERGRDMASHPERAAMLAARVAKLVALRRSPRADRRIATVLFNFPPNAGATGTAAYLAVFASLLNTMRALRDAGYDVDVPPSVDALRVRLLHGNAGQFGTDANVAARIPADDHVRREPHLAEIERQWGAAPGRAQSDLYASNNPSEGMIAKRRAGATLISYLTPPVAHAGLYRGLADLKASIDRWRALSPGAEPAQRDALASLLQSQAALVELSGAQPPWADAEVAVTTLAAALLELEYTLIPHGLHVVGEPLPPAQRTEMLDAAGIADPARRAELDALLAQDQELPAIVHALDGGYVRPAPGGDMLRNPDVLPTGRNLHGFDPFRLPSAFALQDGARQADRLLARYAEDGHRLPETVAMVLWGTDNLKTEGGPIAQALWLMGATPRLDSYGRLAGATLLPLSALGRPRVDVVITLSGIFRDLLPLQTRLLADAALLAAQADEPESDNFVRKHALEFIAAHGGTMEQAALRVFGNADGAYGANVNLLVGNGGWTDEDELADAYVRRKGFAYGLDGRAQEQRAVLGHMLARVEVAYQNLDSIELGVTTIDHYFDTLGGISRAVRSARGGATAAVYIGDQTRGDGTVRNIAEQVGLETRTRALNPKWYEGLLAHGFEGVREIEAHVTNTLGWSATTGQVAPWVYQQIAETYVLDDAMRQRLAALNPVASARIASRLIEAQERTYWTPDAETLAALQQASDELDDRLEGIDVEIAA